MTIQRMSSSSLTTFRKKPCLLKMFILVTFIISIVVLVLFDHIFNYIEYSKHKRDMDREWEKYIRDHNQTENINKQ